MLVACLLLAGAAGAYPDEDANAAFVRFWNSGRTVVALEERPPSRERPPPLAEQRIRVRTEILPMLELDLKNDLEHWMADVDTAVGRFREHHFKKLSEAIAYVQRERQRGRTNPGLASRWLADPLAKKLSTWLPLHWDPLISQPEREVTEAEELLVLFGYRLEPLAAQDFGDPSRPTAPQEALRSPGARLWWRVVKAPDQEAAEAELARRGSLPGTAIYRKVVLVASLRARADRWVIERLEWLDRPPGRARD